MRNSPKPPALWSLSSGAAGNEACMVCLPLLCLAQTLRQCSGCIEGTARKGLRNRGARECCRIPKAAENGARTVLHTGNTGRHVADAALCGSSLCLHGSAGSNFGPVIVASGCCLLFGGSCTLSPNQSGQTVCVVGSQLPPAETTRAPTAADHSRLPTQPNCITKKHRRHGMCTCSAVAFQAEARR